MNTQPSHTRNQKPGTDSPARLWQFAIAGMTCASCVSRVERALQKVPGVQEVTVNLATETATIASAANVELPPLTQAVRAAGYEVPVRSVELAIVGMTCASCVNRVEKALQRVPGVFNASVNLATERASVELAQDADQAAQLQHLITAVNAAGYSAQALDKGVPEPVQALPDWWPIVIGGALTAPLLIPMIGMLAGQHWMIPGWLQWLLATPVQFWLGARFYRAAWQRCVPVRATWICWWRWAPVRRMACPCINGCTMASMPSFTLKPLR